MCCSPWGRKESDMPERLNTNNHETVLVGHSSDPGGHRAWFCACVQVSPVPHVIPHLGLRKWGAQRSEAAYAKSHRIWTRVSLIPNAVIYKRPGKTEPSGMGDGRGCLNWPRGSLRELNPGTEAETLSHSFL